MSSTAAGPSGSSSCGGVALARDRSMAAGLYILCTHKKQATSPPDSIRHIRRIIFCSRRLSVARSSAGVAGQSVGVERGVG